MSTSTPQKSGPSADDQAAVAALPARIVAAWAAQDADAFADVFDEDGTMILSGVFMSGREAIRTFMGESFAGPYKNSRVTGDPIGLRSLGAGLCLLFTEGGVIMGDDTTVRAENTIRASWLCRQTESGWRLAAYQNTPRDAAK
ncbi:SgcJ/EcaC family oxidoreductase [Dactylosporangium sp. NPDC049525]|uniref:SgcJ/EcaC family oxidoreductase n=1 Tax=Dactylosporangium sp. NPDC049525 TaxID=3154730 RepID=UPI00344766CE